VSGGALHGRAAYRIVGGAGGHHKPIKAKSYLDDAGVKVETLARDLASDTGETFADVPAARRGPHYARPEGLASVVLHELAPRAWYVDFAGVTHFGARPSVAYAGDGVRTRVDRASGVTEVATEVLAGLVPGVTIDGSQPATDVEYSLDEKRLTARVYAGTMMSRRIAALARVLDALDPARRYRGLYDFRVVDQVGERLDLQPTLTSFGFGDLQRVPVRTSAGVKAKVALGSIVVVGFANSDPSRPQVIAHDAPDAPGWMPLELLLGEEPQLPIARQTDTIVAGPFAGTITGPPVSRIKAGV
jgi:hypothetical protein